MINKEIEDNDRLLQSLNQAQSSEEEESKTPMIFENSDKTFPISRTNSNRITPVDVELTSTIRQNSSEHDNNPFQEAANF